MKKENLKGLQWVVFVVIILVMLQIHEDLSLYGIANIILMLVFGIGIAWLFIKQQNLRLIISWLLLSFIGLVIHLYIWVVELVVDIPIMEYTSAQWFVSVVGYIGIFVFAVCGLKRR